VYNAKLGPSICARVGAEKCRGWSWSSVLVNLLQFELAAHNTTQMVRSNGVRRLRDRPRWPVQPSDALRSH
jgi:hypothetical protein